MDDKLKREVIHESSEATYAALRDLYAERGMSEDAAEELASAAAASAARTVAVVLSVERPRR
jgi:hypothetical protein